MKIKRGDIFWTDLSPVIGAESGGLRCIVVLQSDELNNKVSLNDVFATFYLTLCHTWRYT